jgi:penicillin-binding protein 1C
MTGRGSRRGRIALAGLGLSAVLAAGLPVGLLALDRIFPPDLTRLEGLSRAVVDRDGQRLRAYLSADGFRRLPTDVASVDPDYLAMLVAFEDKRFWRHGGVDSLALLRAGWQALRHGRIVSGASTLTMQAARLLEPRPRTLGAKLLEMLRAVQLERHFAKDEILGFYLTLAPFGGNLEGVTAASWRYFARPPGRLSAAEAALLVALPQSPTRLRPDRHPVPAAAARDKVLERVATAGLLDGQALAQAKRDPVAVAATPPATAAPHLADRLMAELPGAPVIRTSIDGPLQRHWERVVRRFARSLGPATSIAVLAIENRSRRALVYIGSADFQDPARAGQVDVVRALRSPGSTLKPIIYALAFERGLAHPATLVDDVPTQFGDYAPSNFMDRHYGRISLTEALQRSLNVPAVALLDRLGPVAVAERLRRSGVQLAFGGQAATPGLAFALGGVGTTLEDLVSLYGALADDGHPRPIRYRADVVTADAAVGIDPEPPPLFGETARWYVGEILRGARPPDNLMTDLYRRQARPLAFKTGTSYGFRDAWAIGYDSAHTVGVWIGRPDGTPSPGRFGANTAAPLLLQLFDDLPPAGRTRPPRPAHGLPLDAKLPPGLRLLGEDFARSRIAATVAPPRILYPLDGTVLGLAPNKRPLTLEAEGGRRPLTWIVNGTPLETGRNRWRSPWFPDGLGFNHIVLIDAQGRRAAARIRLVGE